MLPFTKKKKTMEAEAEADAVKKNTCLLNLESGPLATRDRDSRPEEYFDEEERRIALLIKRMKSSRSSVNRDLGKVLKFEPDLSNELKIYNRMLRESQGFDVPALQKVYVFEFVRPLSPEYIEENWKFFDAHLRRVVSYYNEENKDTVICDPVMLKCNVEQERNMCETIYYATFKAFDCDNRTIKEYEARFFRQFFCGRVVIHFCRVKGSKEIPELPFGFANCPKEPAEVRHMPLEKKGLCDRWDHNLWHPDLDPDKIISPDLFQYCGCSSDKICQKNVT